MKNRGSTLILTNLVGVHPRNIHKKFEANPCSGLREVENVFNEDRGTSTQNLKQIRAEVQEKKSTMRYYIVT